MVTPLGPGDCDRPTDRPTPCSLEEVRDSDARLGDLPVFTELLLASQKFGCTETLPVEMIVPLQSVDGQ